jgi:hypothetical protein
MFASKSKKVQKTIEWFLLAVVKEVTFALCMGMGLIQEVGMDQS